ncbi:MAG: hypothetical protein ABSF69_14450 [Polyangiaceae bacterium]
MTAWNPRRIATFDMVRYAENGAYHTLTFAQFCDLPLDERVRLLLVGKPRFFKGDSEVPRLRALARQGEA